MSNKITTSKLLSRIFKANSINSYLDENDSQMDNAPFHEYIQKLCAERGAIPAEIINKADLSRSFGHQLFNGIRKPSRDKVVQLAFGFEMGLDEAQQLLKKAQERTLHPRVRRDAVIIYALSHNHTVDDLHNTLGELHLPPLRNE
jgi:hypothetical protein